MAVLLWKKMKVKLEKELDNEYDKEVIHVKVNLLGGIAMSREADSDLQHGGIFTCHTMDTVAMKDFHMMENREDAVIIWTKN